MGLFDALAGLFGKKADESFTEYTEIEVSELSERESVDGSEFSEQAATDASLKEVGLTSDEKNLIRSDKKLAAVKSVRERTGLDLASAKRLVDLFTAGADVPTSAAGHSAPIRWQLSDEEKSLIEAQRLIEAIKKVRERTGLGLAEAKQLVDEYYRQ